MPVPQEPDSWFGCSLQHRPQLLQGVHWIRPLSTTHMPSSPRLQQTVSQRLSWVALWEELAWWTNLSGSLVPSSQHLQWRSLSPARVRTSSDSISDCPPALLRKAPRSCSKGTHLEFPEEGSLFYICSSHVECSSSHSDVSNLHFPQVRSEQKDPSKLKTALPSPQTLCKTRRPCCHHLDAQVPEAVPTSFWNLE